MEKLKVIFMGTPDFACPTLEKLYYDDDIDLCLVVTKEDKPSGRGKEMKESYVKKLLNSLNEKNYLNDKNSKKLSKVEIITPHRLKDDEEAISKIRELNPDFIVVVAYGQILPKEILDIPKYGCINGHASLLPKYRGASPVQNCIKNGENETGTTSMLMNEGLDTGDILKVKKINIEDEDTAESLFNKLSYLTADCIYETIKDFDSITPIKQNEEEATYVEIIKKEDGLIKPEKETKTEVLNKIRAYNPWPSTHLICNGRRIKIIRAKMVHNDDILKKDGQNKNLKIPQEFCIIEKKLFLRVLDGFLEILELQVEGKRKMAASDYINGLK